VYTQTYTRLIAFLEKYGEKGLIVLKTAFDLSQDPHIDHRLGDFSFKHLVLKLTSIGFNYNPVNLLRILEKEYGIIEKSYSSSNQTWWRFVDIEAVRRVLSEYYNTPFEDPAIKALHIKYKSLEPKTRLDWLKRLLAKDKLTSADKELFKNFVFTELDKITQLISEMEKYEEVFKGEIAILKELLHLADLVSSRIEKPHATSTAHTAYLRALVQSRVSREHVGDDEDLNG
jgi:hypothetical protein